MIHLDTNFLIHALLSGTQQEKLLRNWLSNGVPVSMSVIVWAEFLCRPAIPEMVQIAQSIFGLPEPLTAEDGTKAAELFELGGRRRGSLASCYIAASCIRCNADLATNSLDEFRRFEFAGLRLVPFHLQNKFPIT